MKVSRRGFVGGALAFGAFGAFGASGAEPRLKFGVMSDVHIGSKPDAEATAEKALRWLASENVDAVLCPGDIAHSGLIGELERFAAVWHKVFPGNGQRVELMIATAILSIIPAVNFSGLMVPVASLSGGGRMIGMSLPPAWYQPVSVGVFTKGLGAAELWPNLLALGGFFLLFLIVAQLALRKQEA